MSYFHCGQFCWYINSWVIYRVFLDISSFTFPSYFIADINSLLKVTHEYHENVTVIQRFDIFTLLSLYDIRTYLIYVVN